MKQIVLFFIFLWVGSSSLFSKVLEIPFVQLPTGQLVVKVELSGIENEQLFIIETSGCHCLRGDMMYRLNDLGMDTAKKFHNFNMLKIGDFLIHNKKKIVVNKSIGKRGEHAFPEPVLGTLGPQIFKNKIVQINYDEKVIKVADDLHEFKIPENTPSVHFTQSFMNKIPSVDVKDDFGGVNETVIEISSPVFISRYEANYSDARHLRYRREKGIKPQKISLDGKDIIEILAVEEDQVYINHDIPIYNPVLYISSGLQSMIGNSFLKHFRSTFDFKKKVLYLDPIDEEGVGYVTDPKGSK
ncbi:MULTISPECIES: hypothetical protein [unclassified Saccharicrinis]|uniref:hypothetical protein n=1 Tax=unclassified Saccharicrinis TaxID=2646859 RepID=UPI003D33CD03